MKTTLTTLTEDTTLEEVLDAAERQGLQVHCYGNPVTDGGPVDRSEAEDIAREDSGLLYLEGEWQAFVDVDSYGNAFARLAQ